MFDTLFVMGLLPTSIFSRFHSKTSTGWPKKPPLLSPEQSKARESFMRLWHEMLPKKYGLIERFNHSSISRLPLPSPCRTLEVGAGLGEHSKFEDLKLQDYYVMDYRKDFCDELHRSFPESHVRFGDIQANQSIWPDGFFDRVIAVHVLEHLPDLPKALSEVKRLLKVGGIFDVVLPCEGGFAYSIARKISAERIFRKKFKMDYGPIIKNEHVSCYSEIVAELDQMFVLEYDRHFPLGVPIFDLNLVVTRRYRNGDF